MSQIEVKTENPRLEALHQRLAENSLGGHWQTRERTAPLQPHVWSWSVIYSCLMESGEVVKLGHADEAAKRRTVQLVNPALTGQKATSRTIQMSIQLVKAGERAECHRHTAAALRFVVEADGTGYTTVEGEQMMMEAGDLVLTPNWTWHDHFNPGKNNIVWLDVLDAHLANYLDAMFQENYGEGPAQPIMKPDGHSRHAFSPVRRRAADCSGGTPPYTYKWRDTLQTLKEVAAAGPADPYDGFLLEYTNPLTGGPTMPTIGCWIQRLPAGATTRPHRHTSSTIYHVVEGEGVTSVGDKKNGGTELPWGSRDCFFVPPWKWHRIKNNSRKDPAILFSVTDRPVLESLGLFREERE
jgi:gentisate 1,2-dioxygenase